MDLPGVREIVRPRSVEALPAWQPGDVMLGGGTYLFSEPQPAARRLIDLAALGLSPARREPAGLRIAATCRLAELASLEVASPAMSLFAPAVHCLWGSFKVHNVATVGGNLCLALPAGPMSALMVALDGLLCLRGPGGALRDLPARDFIVDVLTTRLHPGEMLESILLPNAALARRGVLRQASLTRYGRSAALLIGTIGDDGFTLTITAASKRPLRLDFGTLPSAEQVRDAAADALSPDILHDDIHGAPAWKRDRAIALAGEIAEALRT